MKRLDSKNFFRGLGRALDLRGATTPRYGRKTRWIQNDSSALAADWSAVFADLGAAYTRVRQQNAKE